MQGENATQAEKKMEEDEESTQKDREEVSIKKGKRQRGGKEGEEVVHWVITDALNEVLTFSRKGTFRG